MWCDTGEEVLSAKKKQKKCCGELGRDKGPSVWGGIDSDVRRDQSRHSVDSEFWDPIARKCGRKAREDEAQEANFLPRVHRLHQNQAHQV